MRCVYLYAAYYSIIDTSFLSLSLPPPTHKHTQPLFEIFDHFIQICDSELVRNSI